MIDKNETISKQLFEKHSENPERIIGFGVSNFWGTYFTRSFSFLKRFKGTSSSLFF